jgi:membrane protein YdbS with pleckstrin-like domain
MKKKYIDYALVGCLFVLVASVMYAILKLYVFFQRMDMSIIIANVVLFVLVAGVILFLLKKRSDTEEDELLSD